jgi:glutamine amidotransferase
MGNIHSLVNAISFLGCDVQVSNNPDILLSADKLILPGVGAFDKAMENLINLELIEVLNQLVKIKKVPVLGICVGMQIMASRGTENSLTHGLGWVGGTVERILPKTPNSPVPHVGFNDVSISVGQEDPLSNLNGARDYYFTHSYHFLCDDSENQVGVVEYGGKSITAMIRRENVLGVQFHPEKSQTNGLKMLSAFLKLTNA